MLEHTYSLVARLLSSSQGSYNDPRLQFYPLHSWHGTCSGQAGCPQIHQEKAIDTNGDPLEDLSSEKVKAGAISIIEKKMGYNLSHSPYIE